MNSRNKGKRGELELAHKLNEYGYKCRRGQQFSGINGDADVVGLEGIHIECKRVEQLNIDKALEQAVNDAKGDDIPAVFHRKNGTGWKVTLRLDDFMKMYDAYHWQYHDYTVPVFYSPEDIAECRQRLYNAAHPKETTEESDEQDNP